MRNEASADVSGLTIVDLRLERDGHWIALRGVIDSGAPQTIINSRALEALGLSTSSPKVHQSGMVTKGFATASSGRVTWTTHHQNIGIAGWTSGPFETRISDAPVFGVIGLSDKPGAIVGYDVLKRARFGLLPRLRGFCIEAARRNRSR
jgi:hypothetical protein